MTKYANQTPTNPLTDEQLEKLFSIIAHYMMNELEEFSPFEEKSEAQREEVLKVAMRSIETTTVVLKELLKPDAFDFDKINEAHGLIKGNQAEKAHKFIFG